MPITVKQSLDGTWKVLVDGKAVSSGLTNSQAWNEADRLDREPRSYRRSVHHRKPSSRPLTHAGKPADLFRTKTAR
jgi:hypothetical protein